MRSLRVILLVLAALAAASAPGCASARRRAGGDVVRDIHFTGNGGFFSGHNDYQLRNAMQQGQSRWGLLVWPLLYTVEPRVVDLDRLRLDAYRLEVWYAHHGWFDAQVQGWELVRVRAPSERRAAVFDIHGVVAPGGRSTLAAIEILGLPPSLHAVRNATLRGAPIRAGDPFDLSLVQATRDQLERTLHDYARPYAAVELAVDARPDAQEVDATLTATEGILGTFGEIEVDGTEKVPERFVRQAADLEPGAQYSLEALEKAQRALFGLGTFSVVTVKPDLSDASRAEVPVRVHVTESRFRTLRLGGGVDYDGFLPRVRAQAKVRHVNLFHQLVRAELALRAGVTYGPQAEQQTPAATDETVAEVSRSVVPTGGADLTVSYPRLWGGKGSIDLKGTFEQDVYAGLWSYRRPVVDLGLALRPSDAVQLRFGPHFELYQFLGVLASDDTAIALAQKRLFGVDAESDFQYELTALDQLLTLDWTNDPLRPTRGSHTTLSLREAVPLSDRGYGFVRGAAEVKRYVPIRAGGQSSAFPFTLAGRLRGALVVPYGETTRIPLPERAFLGGATSIRGFRQNQVGTYQTLCTSQTVRRRTGIFGLGGSIEETERVVQYHLPDGGRVSADGSVELRYDWAYGLSLAGFVDAGILSPNLSSMSTDQLRGSVGLGVRYHTVAGPLRVDLSFRPLYPEDDGPTQFVADSCGVDDQVPRVYDFFSNFAALRGDAHPPFAMVFYLTFGQAF